MVDLESNTSFPIDKSYQNVIEDLDKWYKQMIRQLDRMHDAIFDDMTRTFDYVHYFASFTKTLLLEQEKQIEQAKSHEEMDIIQERINQIISEVQLLQSLSFHLNSDSVKINGKNRITYNDNDIELNDSFTTTLPLCHNTSRTTSSASDLSINNEQSISSNQNYRFLISRTDAIQLKKKLHSNFHLTSYDNTAINDCVLTFDVSELDSFLNAFALYWNLFRDHNEIRVLISEYNASFLMDKLNESSGSLIKRFRLDKIKIFSHACPKSNERVLLINGKQRNLIKDCIEEIYFNMEKNSQKKYTKQNVKLYNPEKLLNDDIKNIMISNNDYGGFIKSRAKDYSRTNIPEDEESSHEEDDDDDLWDENDEWWNIQYTQNNNSTESIQREMTISNKYAGLVIGVNASRIDRIKQKTGAYVYINGDANDVERKVIMKGTHEQVDRAYACIENLIERYKHDRSSLKQRRIYGKHKEN